jgi:hypothetical protein
MPILPRDIIIFAESVVVNFMESIFVIKIFLRGCLRFPLVHVINPAVFEELGDFLDWVAGDLFGIREFLALQQADTMARKTV